MPLRMPAPDAMSVFLRPKVLLEFDVALNAIAYMPLGALACLILRASNSPRAAQARAVAWCAALSLAMEALQFFVPNRVASIYDLAANAAGAFAGTLVFAEPLHELATHPLAQARERLVAAGGWGDAGLVLVVLWLLAQLNPAIPFFEAGNIVGNGDPQPGDFLVTAGSVALSVAGFGFFVSVVLKGPGGALRWTLLLLTVALWCKFAMASVMLKPHLSAGWVTEGRIVGLAAGLLAFVPLRRLGRTTRIYFGIVLMLAGALLAKIFGAYSALDDFLRLFSWPYGQLATFATLTRFIHEAWPVLALAWLCALFVWRRVEPIQ
ncbi:MAG TPA: VanZ family protein [Usitatibacteraceae bacterium]|nr:VanZ family protein [Usitatibacteraceae bacterium]